MSSGDNASGITRSEAIKILKRTVHERVAKAAKLLRDAQANLEEACEDAKVVEAMGETEKVPTLALTKLAHSASLIMTCTDNTAKAIAKEEGF